MIWVKWYLYQWKRYLYQWKALWVVSRSLATGGTRVCPWCDVERPTRDHVQAEIKKHRP